MSSLAASSFGNPPAGYVSPSFPSLLWTADDRANGALLYYTKDIVRFTIFWTLILVGGMYGAVGLIAGYSHRRITGGVGILAIYLLLGALHAILGGTFSGLITAAIYRAALIAMSTWIPLASAVVQALYLLCAAFVAQSKLI
ncbi:FAFR319Wp [Eremothecium gossypii FDAG1]|nr:FAFR319Wp [Eremothecium gossypii FDAG1]